MAFKMATILAFKKGFMDASPVLLEPIASLKVTVPGPGMAFCGYLRVRIQGGTLSFGQDGIKVEGASAAELYFTAADGYEGYKKPVDEAAKHCVEKCDKRLRQVFSRTYLELRTRHIEDYRSVNKDTEFDLGEPGTSHDGLL